MKGILAGIIAGIAGAVAWAMLAYFTGYEIGWLAWGIGVLVGAAVAWGSEGTPTTGAIAVVITIIALVAGKYITVEVVLAKEMDEVSRNLDEQLQDDEFIISYLAGDIVAEYEQSGQSVDLPEFIDPESVPPEELYPSDIWNEAQEKWSSMTAEEQEEYRALVEEQINDRIRLIVNEAKKEGFIGSFGLFDVIFFLLAVVTAYKVGAKDDSESE
jgi:hypothetical protein